jgi:hypothetical protein
MHITSSELSAATSFVAALAIIGGYLGVRMANQNAVNIAREERNSRNSKESIQLKRDIYTRFAATAIQYRMFIDNADKRREITYQAAETLGLIYLMTHGEVTKKSAQMMEMMSSGETDQDKFMLEIGKLMAIMKADLEGRRLPTVENLDEAVEILFGNVPPRDGL